MIELPNLNNIKIIRKKLGWSQVRLATKVGISQSMINKIEHGIKNPSYDTAEKIFEILSEGLNNHQVSSLKANEIHTQELISLHPEDTIGIAIQKIGVTYDQLPVLENDICVGSLTSKHIIKLLIKENYEILRVGDVMDDPFPIIGIHENLSNIEHILEVFDAVLTSEKGKIVGIITRSDLIKNKF